VQTPVYNSYHRDNEQQPPGECRAPLLSSSMDCPLAGAQPESEFSRVIDEELNKQSHNSHSVGNVAILNVAVLNILDSSFPIAASAAPVLNRRMDCCRQIKQCCDGKG